MEQFTALLAAFGLNPASLGVALSLAVALRLARGMLHWMSSELTYGFALLLGAGGAVLQTAEGDPWRLTVKSALALFCVVMIGQKVLEVAAEKVPWLPKDNEWSAKK